MRKQANGKCSGSQTENEEQTVSNIKHVAGCYGVISGMGALCFYMSELDGGRSPCVSDQPALCCNVFIVLMTSSCVWAQRGGGGRGGQHDVMKAGPAMHTHTHTPVFLPSLYLLLRRSAFLFSVSHVTSFCLLINHHNSSFFTLLLIIK